MKDLQRNGQNKIHILALGNMKKINWLCEGRGGFWEKHIPAIQLLYCYNEELIEHYVEVVTMEINKTKQDTLKW